MNCINLGNVIREKRKEKGMTQKELADILCVTDKAVSKWETGKCYPDISLYDSLIETLDIPRNILNCDYKESKEYKREKRINQIAVTAYISVLIMTFSIYLLSPGRFYIKRVYCFAAVVIYLLLGVAIWAVRRWRARND